MAPNSKSPPGRGAAAPARPPPGRGAPGKAKSKSPPGRGNAPPPKGKGKGAATPAKNEARKSVAANKPPKPVQSDLIQELIELQPSVKAMLKQHPQFEAAINNAPGMAELLVDVADLAAVFTASSPQMFDA
ncbi:unnamed protein product, partial [Amoebophrya sp. A25]|eukprot:GSA25T00007383001.1